MAAYEPGDLLSVFPRPDPAAIDAFLERMGLQGEKMVRVTAAASAAAAADNGRENGADPAAGSGQQAGAEVASGTIRSFVEVCVPTEGKGEAQSVDNWA